MGERANESPRYLTLMQRFEMGAFHENTARRLTNCGVVWSHSVNLCNPGPSRLEWNSAEAAETVAAVIDQVTRGEWELVILAGRRVANCFGFQDSPLPSLSGKYLIVPHPSGRNRVWNQGLETILAIRKLWDQARAEATPAAADGRVSAS